MRRQWWVCALLCVLSTIVTQSASVRAADLSGPVGLADGPGIWINLWSYPDGDLEAYCLKLHNTGIRNVFIQTSRSNTESIRQPETLGALIDTCHHYKIRVIAWSFVELSSPEADARKLIDAARFLSHKGQGFDAIAPNIEKELSYQKVEQFSKILREELGENYPMIAVVFSPLNKASQVAGTPWKLLDKYYDVIAPMNYWNSKYAKLDPYTYTCDTIRKVRELIGRPDVEIHVIGDGMKTHAPAIQSFLKGCRDTAVTSASLYPFHKMTEEQWQCLKLYYEYFPVNSRFRLAALSELLKSGGLSRANIDPARPISRGEFYHLFASRLTGRSDLNEAQSIRFLIENGLVPEPHKQAIANSKQYADEPMEHWEAYSLVANGVEARSRAGKTRNPLWRKPMAINLSQAQRRDWFSLPAQAQPSNAYPSGAGTRQVLNYLDAAQIILSTEPGLH